MANKNDIHFIMSSWLKSYRSSDTTRGIGNSLYYKLHHRVLENIIPRSTIIVAADENDPDAIVGWMCAETVNNMLVVHYVYVKYMYRRMGVAKQMLQLLKQTEKPDVLLATHRTHMVGHKRGEGTPAQPCLLDSYGFIYNPYYLYMTLPEGWENGYVRRA